MSDDTLLCLFELMRLLQLILVLIPAKLKYNPSVSIFLPKCLQLRLTSSDSFTQYHLT